MGKNRNTVKLLSGNKQITATLAEDKGGVVVEMDGPVNGVFTAQLKITTAETVQVALLAYTYDATDKAKIGSDNRRTPWKGSAYGKFGEAGFSFTHIQEHIVTTTECPSDGKATTPKTTTKDATATTKKSDDGTTITTKKPGDDGTTI